MRSLRSSTVPPVSRSNAPVVLADLRLKVVTPMFGGSVEPGIIDRDRLIRAAAIRGHLRFWWRVCNAAAVPTVEELQARERALWGSAAKKDDISHGPGAIGIEVTEVESGSAFTHQEIPRPGKSPRRVWRREGDNGENQCGPDYALFPFTRQQDPPRDPRSGMVDITFRLTLTLQPHASVATGPGEAACVRAAEQALWAWITFGGVGSRTRRGCGALQVVSAGVDPNNALLPATNFHPDAANLSMWLKEKRNALIETGAGVLLVPRLGGAILEIKPGQRSAITAWRQAVEPMFQFRQGRGIGRNHGGGNRPGQSRWPEPGAVREIGKLNAGGAYSRTSDADGRDFPRADLGLPILFQNMRDRGQKTPTLEGGKKDFTRMASPVILTIIAVDDTTFVPVALLLSAPHVWNREAPGVHLKDEEIGATTSLQVGPMNDPNRQPRWPFPGNEPPFTAPANGKRSARYAFMDYFGGTRVW